MEKVKRKKDEEEKVRLEEAYEEFRETFEEGVVKVSKTFIRGDVVNPDRSASKKESVKSSIYKPSPFIQIKPIKALDSAKKMAQETAKKIMKEADNDESRPAKSGKKNVPEKSRLTNLEAFKEELKQMQAMRDERKGLRHHLKEKLGVPEEELNRIAPPLDAPYSGPGVVAFADFENDPSTTNLYVCNLPADAKVEDFFETFGTFGPLASAKVLYPKPDEERYRLSGFVAYMSRMDAERALCVMHGELMRECEMRVSWARPVMIPPLPFYVPPPLRELAMPDPPSGLPFNAKPLTEDLRAFLKKYHDLPKLNAPMPDGQPKMVEDYKKMVENATVRVVIPTERPLLHLIHRVVEFLVNYGPLFEAVLMARERQNPMYRFLFDNHHPTHVYYRWKLYTILQGDDRQKWRLEKFRMFEGGSWWQPPPHSLFEQGMPPQLYETAYQPKRQLQTRERGRRRTTTRPDRSQRSESESDDDDEERKERRRKRMKEDLDLEEKQRKMRGILNDKEREELEDLIRGLTPEKIGIGDAMIWCLDHAECSKEITECIYESLCLKETPLHKKIARIYLVSDILANCSVRVKDAFYYRQHFSEYLQKIFIELNETLESIESRLKAEQFRQRVMLCFRNWEDHAVYPTQDLIQWQNIFLGLLKGTGVETDSSIDGEPIPPEEEEEDAEMGEDIDGVPIGGEEDDDIDGVPIGEGDFDADLDGVPMDEEKAVAECGKKDDGQHSPEHFFTAGTWSTVEPEEPIAKKPSTPVKSKWESMDISRWDNHANVSTAFSSIQAEEEEQSEPTRKRHKLQRLTPSPTRKESKRDQTVETEFTGNADGANEEDRRRMLREIEMNVMKLQDELEAENKSQEEIQSELANYRQKLLAKMERKIGGKNNNRQKSEENSRKEEENHHKRRRDREEGGGHTNQRNSDEDRNNGRKEKRRGNSRERQKEKHRRNSRERSRERRRDDSRERLEESRRHHRDRSRDRDRSREDRGRKRDRDRSREDRGRGRSRDRSGEDRGREENRRRGRSRSRTPDRHHR